MHQDKPSICEEKTFSAIFREYSETLVNYLYYKTGNEHISRDLAQEAFTRLWQNCLKVNLETAKGYVFKIAGNLLLNEYDHQQVVLKFQQIRRPASQTPEDPQFLLEENELKIALEKAIASLPEKQRVVFLLSRIDKKTYSEIAELLQISRQAVEKRMYNALESLRQVSTQIK